MGLHGLLGHVDEPRSRSVGLQTALPAAGALPSVVDDDLMAQLSAEVVEARVDFPVDDDAAADAGAQRHHDGVLVPLGGPGQDLAVSGHVGVVFHVDFLPGPLLHVLPQGGVPEFQVVGVDDGPGLRLHRPGSAHADAVRVVHGQPRLFQGLPGALDHPVRHQLRIAHRVCGGHHGLGHDLIVLVHHAGLDEGSAQVDSNVILHVGFLTLQYSFFLPEKCFRACRHS